MSLDLKNLNKEVRRLVFKSKRPINKGLVGEYKSSIKGQGIEFEELREYRPGDDIRSIDWKVTARTKTPHLKVYKEEKDITILLIVEQNQASEIGTRNCLKSELIAKIAALLCFIAKEANNKIGLLNYSENNYNFLKPKSAKVITPIILKELSNEQSKKKFTANSDNQYGLKTILNLQKKHSIVFLVTANIELDEDLSKIIKKFSTKHQLCLIQISDPSDYQLPNSKLIQIRNPQSNQIITIDSSNKNLRKEYQRYALQKREELVNFLKRNDIDFLEIFTNQDYLKELKNYFHCKQTFTSEFALKLL